MEGWTDGHEQNYIPPSLTGDNRCTSIFPQHLFNGDNFVNFLFASQGD